VSNITIQVVGDRELAEKFRARRAGLAAAVAAEMHVQMARLRDYTVATRLQTDPLHHRTGKLSTGVHGDVEVVGSTVIGTVGVDGDAVPYAVVHEEGMTVTVPSHMRRLGYNSRLEQIKLMTKTGKVRSAVKAMSRGVVKSHAATYPQRAFLKPSFEDRRQEIVDALRQSISDHLNAT
jgi:hypothetical protein